MSAQPVERTARKVPVFRWSAPTRWTPKPDALVLLVIGLVLFGVGDSLIVNSRLGNTPWTTLADGVARHTPLDLGEATIVVSFLVLLGWIPLRERPGIGTIGNALIIGSTVKFATRWLPEPSQLAARVAFVLVGIAVVAVGGALYLSTHLGPGPRDGWMTGLGKRLGVPIARVRITVEVVVMGLGWLLGGRLGFGTLAFALTVGHALAFSLARLALFAGAT
jgi:uncharacterized membrane protein YczE